MGGLISVFSSSANEGSSLDDPVSRPGLGDLPESCITSILARFAPLEICKLAQLNRAFWGASSADNLWESKLPSNYMFLVERVLGEHAATSLTKKGIYARLCRRNSFDGGSKEVWLDKVSGDVCLSISSKALKITGIDDRRYWNLISTEESRFNTVAYLKQIWWVELVGGIEFQFPPGNYGLYFRLQLGRTIKRFGRRICDLDRVHGWDMKPVQFQLLTSEGQETTSECYLHDPGNWVHYHAGDFVVENPNRPIMVRFSMVQIDCTHTKGGLCVDSVLICPSKQLKSRSRLQKFPLSI